MSLVGAIFVAGALARAAPTVHGWSDLLGGVDAWDGVPTPTGELRLAASWGAPLPRADLDGVAASSVQAWRGGTVADTHYAHLAWTGRRAPHATAGPRLRGSVASRWGELSLLGGASPLQRADRALLLVAGPALRGGTGTVGLGAVARGQAWRAVGQRWGLHGHSELQLWPGAALPTLVADGEAGAWLAARPFTQLALGPGLSWTAPGAPDHRAAGLPPAGIAIARAWLTVEHRLAGPLWVRAEAVWEQATGTESWRHARAVVGVRLRGSHRPTPAPVATEPALRHFALHAPGATEVELLASFLGWQPLRLEGTEGSTFALTVAVPPGVHRYVYRVDGQVVVPPEARHTVDDGFGGRNAVLVVP